MEKEETTRPSVATEEHLEFLDDLRESGETNMWGAAPYLRREFSNLTKDEAASIFMYWMKSFPRKPAS